VWDGLEDQSIVDGMGPPVSIQYFVEVQRDHEIDLYDAARALGIAEEDTDTVNVGAKCEQTFTVALHAGYALPAAFAMYQSLCDNNRPEIEAGRIKYIRLRIEIPDWGSDQGSNAVLAMCSKDVKY
jgi:hypothetical protein